MEELLEELSFEFGKLIAEVWPWPWTGRAFMAFFFLSICLASCSRIASKFLKRDLSPLVPAVGTLAGQHVNMLAYLLAPNSIQSFPIAMVMTLSMNVFMTAIAVIATIWLISRPGFAPIVLLIAYETVIIGSGAHFLNWSLGIEVFVGSTMIVGVCVSVILNLTNAYYAMESKRREVPTFQTSWLGQINITTVDEIIGAVGIGWYFLFALMTITIFWAWTSGVDMNTLREIGLISALIGLGGFFIVKRKSRAVAVVMFCLVLVYVYFYFIVPFVDDRPTIAESVYDGFVYDGVVAFLAVAIAWRGIRATWAYHQLKTTEIAWKRVTTVSIVTVFSGVIALFIIVPNYKTGLDEFPTGMIIVPTTPIGLTNPSQQSCSFGRQTGDGRVRLGLSLSQKARARCCAKYPWLLGC